jgi:hypothetical protein
MNIRLKYLRKESERKLRNQQNLVNQNGVFSGSINCYLQTRRYSDQKLLCFQVKSDRLIKLQLVRKVDENQENER